MSIDIIISKERKKVLDKIIVRVVSYAKCLWKTTNNSIIVTMNNHFLWLQSVLFIDCVQNLAGFSFTTINRGIFKETDSQPATGCWIRFKTSWQFSMRDLATPVLKIIYYFKKIFLIKKELSLGCRRLCYYFHSKSIMLFTGSMNPP